MLHVGTYAFPFVGNAIITARSNHCHALKSKLHELITLSYLIIDRVVALIETI